MVLLAMHGFEAHSCQEDSASRLEKSKYLFDEGEPSEDRRLRHF